MSATASWTRVRFFRHLWQPPETAKALYLDVGCGAGTYSQFLADEAGLEVVGIDYSVPTLVKARQRISESIRLCAADAMRLPFGDARFDGALCFGVLQAVADSAPVARELARVLKPGAGLWIDALNRDGVASRYERTRLHWQGKSMHLRYESPRRLSDVLQNAGFDRPSRHWLPILPARFRGAQPMLETRWARATLRHVYPLGLLLSHAFVLTTRRAMA